MYTRTSVFLVAVITAFGLGACSSSSSSTPLAQERSGGSDGGTIVYCSHSKGPITPAEATEEGDAGDVFTCPEGAVCALPVVSESPPPDGSTGSPGSTPGYLCEVKPGLASSSSGE
jgi:hypothetical protein